MAFFFYLPHLHLHLFTESFFYFKHNNYICIAYSLMKNILKNPINYIANRYTSIKWVSLCS